MKPVSVGVIGAGYWGPNLIRNFYCLPEADLQVVCDRKQERLDHIRSLYPGVCTTPNLEDLLNTDIEAVAIATPVSTHYSIAMACLRAGKHVLVEKPLARTSQEARELVETARAMGRLIMAGHTFLYNPAVVALKEIISSGEIGQIFYIQSTRVNLGLYQPDTNVIWDLAPHDISILFYILGMEPISVSARGGMYLNHGVHDVAHVTLNFESKIMADLHVSWLDPCKIRRITIVGNKKMIVYDDIEQEEKVKIYDKGIDVQPYNDTYEDFHLAYRYGDVVTYPVKWEEPLMVECRHFLECIRTGSPVRSDGVQGMKVIQVLEAAQKSLSNGGTGEIITW
ncbi:MAG: Gfo/Idh/MocA family oxidoreductase [Chloroflexi bacterium]|jgi:predicted dehydrogenase|nr:Gfo/Idh/MocA family oxidoreductase [Chloroflexota bacterium]